MEANTKDNTQDSPALPAAVRIEVTARQQVEQGCTPADPAGWSSVAARASKQVADHTLEQYTAALVNALNLRKALAADVDRAAKPDLPPVYNCVAPGKDDTPAPQWSAKAVKACEKAVKRLEALDKKIDGAVYGGVFEPLLALQGKKKDTEEPTANSD